MKTKIRCNIHKKKVIEAICLDSDCQQQPLSCFDCRSLHQQHSQSNIYLDDFLESVYNKFNISYLQNDFNHKCNQIKSLKEEFLRDMNKQVERIQQLAKIIVQRMNSSLDSQIKSITTSYLPYLKFMQNIKNFYESPFKPDDNMFSKVRETFKISNFKFNQENPEEKIFDIEFIPSKFIDFPIAETQLSYCQISQNIIASFENFENQLKNFRITTIPRKSQSQQRKSTQKEQMEVMKTDNSISQQQKEELIRSMIKNLNAYTINNESSQPASKLKQDVLNQKELDQYIEESKQIRMNVVNFQTDFENNLENFDFVNQSQSRKIDVSPQVNFKKKSLQNVNQSVQYPTLVTYVESLPCNSQSLQLTMMSQQKSNVSDFFRKQNNSQTQSTQNLTSENLLLQNQKDDNQMNSSQGSSIIKTEQKGDFHNSSEFKAKLNNRYTINQYHQENEIRKSSKLSEQQILQN